LAIAGPSGSGKTYTALSIAASLGKKVALVDTEHGSASKYADLFHFDVMEMEPPFNPDRFGKAIIEAQTGGYDVIILDSLSHAWNGTGGLLELVDQFAMKYKGNTFAGWKEGTPIYNKLIDTIVQTDIHVIATMRSKQDYVLETGDDGKQRPKKVGMAPIQRDGFEYEFDVFMEMDIDNIGRVIKSRCPDLTGRAFKLPGKDVAGILADWLKGVPHIETTDVLGKTAVDWAAKQWNIAPKEAREQIQQGLNDGRLEANMPKDEFKKFVAGL
jgi:hypothetical protein